MPEAASRLKIRPGRIRTTRVAGCSCLEAVEQPLDLGLVAGVEGLRMPVVGQLSSDPRSFGPGA